MDVGTQTAQQIAGQNLNFQQNQNQTQVLSPVEIKILIVEDEVPLLKALSTTLSKEGFNVIEALDGNQGFQIAQTEIPSLILTDIVMPGMNGLDMVKNLRSTEWGKNIDVVFLTNLNNSQDVASALQYGVVDYFVKSDMKLKDIVIKIKEKLGMQS